MASGTGPREDDNTGFANYLLKPREESILIICGVLLALIFILDISLAIGFVVSIFYVVPVLMCIWSPRRRTIFLVAGVASILTLVAVPLKPSGEFLIPLFNRPLSLIALWTVTLLIDRFSNERKKAEQALRESEGRMRLAQQVANIGTFEWNIQTGVNVWTPELEAMYGLTPGGFPGTQPAWEALVHPDDREEATRRVSEAIEKGSFESEWRVVWPDGSVHWLQGKGWVFRDDHGRPLKLLGVNIDITERKIAQQSIEESKRNEQARRQELEALMDAVPATIWISRDQEGANIVGNKATEELLGVQPGSNVSETAPLDRRQQHFHAYRDGKAITPCDLPIQEVGRTGKAVEGIEFELRFDDGRSVWLYGNAVPLIELGKTRGAVGAFVDITPRKEAEVALKESERRFFKMFQSNPSAVAITRASDSRYVDVNEAWVKLFGWSREEALGRVSKELGMFPSNYDEVKSIVAQTMIDGKARGKEVAALTKDGRRLHILSSTEALTMGGEELILSSTIDITAIHEAHRLLEEERARFQLIMENIPVAVGITDDKGGIVAENGVLARIWAGDVPLSEVPDYRHYNAWWPDTGKEVEREEWPAAKALKGEASTAMFDIQKFDGTRGAVIVSAVPVVDKYGNIIGAVWINQDVTELRRTEDDLRRSNEELQQFAYVASHDMQEHLRMVILYLGLLNKRFDTSIDPRAKEYMTYINSGAERMRQLVNDLLEFARIDSQVKEFTTVDMNDVARAVWTDLQGLADQARAKLVLEPLPTVQADEGQMKQLLTNLLSNAIKFRSSEPPMIEVFAVTYANEFVFSVKDNGIGIDPKYIPSMFKMFSRLHTKDEYSGTGIGLAICKKIVERHGGRIWFESEPGKGTTFYFTIPVWLPFDS